MRFERGSQMRQCAGRRLPPDALVKYARLQLMRSVGPWRSTALLLADNIFTQTCRYRQSASSCRNLARHQETNGGSRETDEKLFTVSPSKVPSATVMITTPVPNCPKRCALRLFIFGPLMHVMFLCLNRAPLSSVVISAITKTGHQISELHMWLTFGVIAWPLLYVTEYVPIEMTSPLALRYRSGSHCFPKSGQTAQTFWRYGPARGIWQPRHHGYGFIGDGAGAVSVRRP